MELKKLTDRIFYLPHNPDYDRPLLGYVKGNNYSLMIDAGTSPKHVQAFNTGLLKHNLDQPNFVVITHWHWDHTFGMSAAKGFKIAHKKTNEKLKELQRYEWSEEAMKARIEQGIDTDFKQEEFRNEYENLSEIMITTADLVVNQDLYLDLGEITAEIFHVEAPHSDDSLLIYIPEEKILFIGDATSEDFFNNYYLDLQKLKSLIKTLESIDFTYCLLGHTDPVRKLDILEYLRSLI
ncbi:MBL fold metallo-hydrolase [Amphibacillus sp. Q70]|uniref:MBL fold metallo-hydrolase n=1 Tax=Amphibacillus sp. Q70 TaxID=3453416 RepID=UPI003F8628E4